MGPAGQQQGAGPAGGVGVGLGDHHFGVGQRLGRPAELEHRAAVDQPVGQRHGPTGQGGGPLGQFGRLRRFAGTDRPPGQPAQGGHPGRCDRPRLGVRAQAHLVGQRRGPLGLVGDERVHPVGGPAQPRGRQVQPGRPADQPGVPFGQVGLADAGVGGLAHAAAWRRRTRSGCAAASAAAAAPRSPGPARSRRTRRPSVHVDRHSSRCRRTAASAAAGTVSPTTDASRSTARASAGSASIRAARTAARSRLSSRPASDCGARCQAGARLVAQRAPLQQQRDQFGEVERVALGGGQQPVGVGRGSRPPPR